MMADGHHTAQQEQQLTAHETQQAAPEKQRRTLEAKLSAQMARQETLEAEQVAEHERVLEEHLATMSKAAAQEGAEARQTTGQT